MARSSRYPNHEFGVIRLRELPVDLPVCDSPERIYDYWVANVTTASLVQPGRRVLLRHPLEHPPPGHGVPSGRHRHPGQRPHPAAGGVPDCHCAGVGSRS